MRYTKTRAYRGMGEFLFRKWHDGELDADDEHRDLDIGGGFAQFGRRVIVDVEGLPIQYTRHETVRDACEHMGRLHDQRAPVFEFDAIIHDAGDDYRVSFEGKFIDGYKCREDAEYALALYMVDAGCFPDAFMVNGRGNFHRIDWEIREYHDAGGDGMRAHHPRRLGEGWCYGTLMPHRARFGGEPSMRCQECGHIEIDFD